MNRVKDSVRHTLKGEVCRVNDGLAKTTGSGDGVGDAHQFPRKGIRAPADSLMQGRALG